MTYECIEKCYWGMRLYERGERYSGQATPPEEWFKAIDKPKVAPKAPEVKTEVAPEVKPKAKRIVKK